VTAERDDVDEHVGGGFNPPVPTNRGGPEYGRFVEAVRTLQDLTRGADAPDGVIAEAAELIESAGRLLAPYDADEWHSPSGRRMDLPNRGNILQIPVDLTVTEAGRIGEARDDVEKLEHRAGPAVQQEQRHRIGADTGYMQVVQVDVVKRHAELWKGVQRGFLGPPVELAAPVFGEPAKIRDIGAIGPCITGRLVGETRAGQTVAEIADVGVRNTKRE